MRHFVSGTPRQRQLFPEIAEPGQQANSLIGMTCGKLTVVGQSRAEGHGKWYCCQCACGGTAIVRADQLLSGHTRSCGCLRREHCRELGLSRKGLRAEGAGRPHIDMTGQRFGCWTVVGPGKRTGPHWTWLCICRCGNRRLVAGTELRLHRSKSCGCASRKASRRRAVLLNRVRLYGDAEVLAIDVEQPDATRRSD